MDDKKENTEQTDLPAPDNASSYSDLRKTDERQFDRVIEQLIEESEEMRMSRVRQYHTRGLVSMNLGILSVLLGVGGFGWFFLMNADLPLALVCIVGSIVPPIVLNLWTQAPIKTYAREHKTKFMPKLAHALGGFSFHPERGVSSKILEKLVVLPRYRIYDAEDCFMGTYKGVKVLFSEARLYSYNRRNGADFDGIFVLLEVPGDVFEGHTIITSDHKMVKEREKTLWKKLQKVFVSVENPEWDKFVVYSTKPDTAELMLGEKLFKELAEASEIFSDAPLTAVMFGKKYVFMMIPNSEDMFEPSNMFVPITTKTHAMQCRKEISQILEVIDVFDLYKHADH
ncbi:MAG: DUF3137 domain-containing protein [Alphaproteobacteria bacterium]|nr:DUF3137 domain-containing protein [Alphaproteobacteria bacterium]